MKNRVLKFIALVLVTVAFFITLSIEVNGYDIYTYSSYKSLNNIELLQSDSQVYLIGTNGRDVKLDAVYPESYTVDLKLEHNAYTYNLFSNILVFVCPVDSLDQTHIILYDIYDDTFTSFYISGSSYCESSQIAYSNGYVYIADDYGNVTQYSTKGKVIYTYEVHVDRCHLMCDYNGTIYCTSNNTIYELTDKNIYKICKRHIDAPSKFISDNAFIDDSGYIYTFGNNSISKLINTISTVTFPSGGIYNNCVIIAEYDTIYAVDINSDRISKFIRLNRQIESICTVDDNILALNYQNGFPTVSHIKYSNLRNYTYNDSASDKYPDISDNIYSETYVVDHQKQWITDIEPGTTVAQFKRNMNFDGFEASFVRFDGKVIESGKIGTATVVTFYNDEITIEYELSVKGDLTGEGNMNSRDKNVLFDHLLEETKLTGVYVDAADLDYSNNINTVDLVILTTEIEDIEL